MKEIFVDGETPTLTVRLESARDVAWFIPLINALGYKVDDGPFCEGGTCEFPIKLERLVGRSSDSKVRHVADFCRTLVQEKASVIGSLPSTMKDLKNLTWYAIDLSKESAPRRMKKKEIKAMKR